MQLLEQINARLAAAGREVFAKKAGAPLAALEIKADSYVLETDVHFPTDLNLLWDAGRKCVDLRQWTQCVSSPKGCRVARLAQMQGMAAATQEPATRRQPDRLSRRGEQREARMKQAVREYLTVGGALSGPRCEQSLLGLCETSDLCHLPAGNGWPISTTMLDKHLDLVERRLLNGGNHSSTRESRFPYSSHTPSGYRKANRGPNVELGHKLLIATDQNQLIQDYAVLMHEAEVDQSIPVADRLLGRYGVGQRGQREFRQGIYARRRPATAGTLHPRSGDAQTREEERDGNGT